jgi:nucleoside-diphosphate-sugar epimerase
MADPDILQSKPPLCLCLGYGYVAQAFGAGLRARGGRVIGTRRAGQGRDIMAFDGGAASPALREAFSAASVILVSIPPGRGGDPTLTALADASTQPNAWIGYLSTTAVYGDLGGGWAFEDGPFGPREPRGQARLDAEAGWRARGAQVFRLAGIYGPGRSPFDRLRAGDAQRIIKPGQVFSRIHRDDIVSALRASLDLPQPGAVYNLCDDAPTPPQDVIAFAAGLIGAPCPPDTPIGQAHLSQLAASFYAGNRRVSNARAKAALGWRPAFPSYREGLAAVLAAESG